MTRVLALPFALAAAAAPAAAEIELSAYLGAQSAPHSSVEGDDPAGVGAFDFGAGWEGRSFEMPPQYGLRATWWRDGGPWGYGVEFNHAKVYADDETLADSGFSRLEFTDGLNFVTANVFRRFDMGARVTPYVGAGLGVSVPYVEVRTRPGAPFTEGLQVGGPAAQVVAGASYDLGGRWRVFGEYKGTYSRNEVDLDGGGELSSDIVTNALNLGFSYGF